MTARSDGFPYADEGTPGNFAAPALSPDEVERLRQNEAAQAALVRKRALFSGTYTPGPWRIGFGYAVVTDSDYGTHTDPESRAAYGGNLICESVLTGQNAALIAAAPELYEALTMLLPLAEAWADGKGRSHPDHECVEAARAAIAKATSQEPAP